MFVCLQIWSFVSTFTNLNSLRLFNLGVYSWYLTKATNWLKYRTDSRSVPGSPRGWQGRPELGTHCQEAPEDDRKDPRYPLSGALEDDRKDPRYPLSGSSGGWQDRLGTHCQEVSWGWLTHSNIFCNSSVTWPSLGRI